MNSLVSVSMWVILVYVILEGLLNRYKYKEESFFKIIFGLDNSNEF